MAVCSFPKSTDTELTRLVMRIPIPGGPGLEDLTSLWDGTEKGWKLEASSDDVRVALRLGKPLGELPADRLDALREALGERRYNRLSALQAEMHLSFWGNHSEGRKTLTALRAVGFDAELAEPVFYEIVRENGGRRSAHFIDNEAERNRIVNRMIEAGVPIACRDRRGRSPVHVRRGIGVLVCFAPVLLLGASAIFAASRGSAFRPVGVAVTLAATVIGALNFYLSFMRPAFYARAKGSFEGYRHVPGFPFMGTVLMVSGAVLGFGSLLSIGLGLISIALDTGGSAWFLVSTWRDTGFWDR